MGRRGSGCVSASDICVPDKSELLEPGSGRCWEEVFSLRGMNSAGFKDRLQEDDPAADGRREAGGGAPLPENSRRCAFGDCPECCGKAGF